MRGLRMPGRAGNAASPAKVGSRIGLLIGERRGTVAALAFGSVVSGFTEAALLAVFAQIAFSIAGTGKERLHGLHVHAPTHTLLLIAFGLALVRLLIQFPLSVLPARIAADVQASMRRRLFNAFTVASWSVQSADREGQLQETMSGQVMQAGSGALQVTSLITSSLTFLVMLTFAFALNAVAAAAVFVTAIGMFALLRPLRNVAVRRSRRLSRAQVRYTAAVAESNRLAEETQVFGVGDQQRERMEGFVEKARVLLYRAQLVARLVPNMYQSLIYVFLVAALWLIYELGAGHN